MHLKNVIKSRDAQTLKGLVIILQKKTEINWKKSRFIVNQQLNIFLFFVVAQKKKKIDLKREALESQETWNNALKHFNKPYQLWVDELSFDVFRARMIVYMAYFNQWLQIHRFKSELIISTISTDVHILLSFRFILVLYAKIHGKCESSGFEESITFYEKRRCFHYIALIYVFGKIFAFWPQFTCNCWEIKFHCLELFGVLTHFYSARYKSCFLK